VRQTQGAVLVGPSQDPSEKGSVEHQVPALLHHIDRSAKIQNAAAVIDRIGIEGEVIRYGVVIAIPITLLTTILAMMWAFA